MKKSRMIIAALIASALAPTFSSCRGGESKSPPIHIVPDMDFQPKFRAQARSEFAAWSDHRAMRLPVEGTVRRQTKSEKESRDRYPAMLEIDGQGKKGGEFVGTNPLPKTRAVLDRGRERFNITCAVCHGRTGKGGLVAKRWPLPVPSLVEPTELREPATKILDAPPGDLFDVISNGRSTMPSYSHQISVEDRWAIVHYLKALQLHFKK